jgi:hypothetical protein
MKHLLDDISTLSIPRDVLATPTESSETVLSGMPQCLQSARQLSLRIQRLYMCYWLALLTISDMGLTWRQDQRYERRM